MPSSSAPVDPEKLGHPVALTRGPEDGSANESANGSTVQASRGVSFATEETHASESVSQQETASTAGGQFSVRDFAPTAEAKEDGSSVQTSRGVSFATEETHSSESVTQEKTASTAGGLFSVPDFAPAAKPKEEEVVSPSEAGTGAAIDSVK